ncbi:cobalt-precorrin-6A reductase [Pseudogemmobacter faecipullorum]|uniref:Cobalt-precorrin-6A reductase n=1 Tax=Pseudogemmobacter faecipullorum TaxID=2755041 RepID=A0ABS8CN94_9RHOB|nr:cobalt-precorrin-6A reductase [Pseudogemmobacter faecipullorum]MCB5410670.1 cobalt-precorrin-6A reductase [Pseudogemmobacter faecipullorum]
MKPVLLLGGTTEASALARELAEHGIAAIFSYAGRVESPKPQPLPTRTGGFGGAEGLADWLQAEGISAVIDATHPFAARMSQNAARACAGLNLPLCRLERAPWRPGPGDLWHQVPDLSAAHALLQGPPRRVFLAIGRQHIGQFRDLPQHHYLLRLIDPPDEQPLPQAEMVISRGPFSVAEDLALLRAHRTGIILCKNAGGSGASAKLEAARQLQVPVIMIARPELPEALVFHQPDQVIAWLHTRLGV